MPEICFQIEEKYGFPCGRALGQLQKIEATAQQYLAAPDRKVTVLQFEE